MNALPALAVVGHPNKGKSSVVATLVESTEIAIAATPGTTTRSSRWTLTAGAQPCYELFDTPGFQRPRHVLDWLQRNSGDASDRPTTVRRFIDHAAAHGLFDDERELLQPLMDGAGILYVVDGAQPYAPEYETEMEILQWTGRPRMALINRIGQADHVSEWQTALGQYFSIVQLFDAQQASFDQRLGLLRAFAELDPQWRAPLALATTALQTDRAQRRHHTAQEMASLLIDALTASAQREIPRDADQAPVRASLRAALEADLGDREQRARRTIEEHWAHFGLERQETQASLLATALFSAESFRLFGLSRAQLVSTGATAGAATGVGFDILLGGASLMLGAAIGAAAGAAGGWFGASRLASQRILGHQVGRTELRVGPINDPNFVWVVLGRSLFHFELIARRTHARRDPLIINPQATLGSVTGPRRSAMARLFRRISTRGEADPGVRNQLETLLLAHIEEIDQGA